MVLLQLNYFSRRHSPPKWTFGKGAREAAWAAEQRTIFFFLKEKRELVCGSHYPTPHGTVG